MNTGQEAFGSCHLAVAVEAGDGGTEVHTALLSLLQGLKLMN